MTEWVFLPLCKDGNFHISYQCFFFIHVDPATLDNDEFARLWNELVWVKKQEGATGE